ncbi:penicillin-binding protein 2, partial [bacterium]|nr:penicillin-binding protein 2 [bacterium]
IRINQEQPPQDGKDLYLTIELPVQFKAEEIIKEAVKTYGAESGQIIVMNPKTGAVIAMASSYGFNPEEYAKEAREKGIEVFYNPITSKLFEPGSIFKVIPMAGALEEGLVEPYTKMNLSAYIEVQGHKIWTSDRKAHGNITMTQVLELSDNVGIVKVEQLLGKERFYRYLVERFRLSLPLGIDLPNEVSPEIPSLKELREIRAATMAFGQGLAVTPLQAVSVFCAIANKGVLMRPYVVGKKVGPNGEEEVVQPQEIGRVISEETAEKLTDMLVGVVEEGYGILAKIEGYKIAGKTGTAQVPSPEGGYYPDKTIQSFAGFFPADDPQFVILVKLDYPTKSKWGSLSAAPTFRRLAEFLINYYQIPPSEEEK